MDPNDWKWVVVLTLTAFIMAAVGFAAGLRTARIEFESRPVSPEDFAATAGAETGQCRKAVAP